MPASSPGSGPAQRGSAAAIRRAIARAVPDGRSALPRRCHSTIDGSKAPAGAYQRRGGLREPQEQRRPEREVRRDDGRGAARRGAARGRAPRRRPSPSSPGRTAVAGGQRVLEVVERRPRRAEASTTTSARNAAGAARRPSAGRRAIGSGQPVAAAAAAIAPPRRPGSVDRGAASSDVLPRGAAVPEVRGITKAAAPSWCPRPLGASGPGGSVVRRSRAVRAPGPEPSGRAARASSSASTVTMVWVDMARAVCPMRRKRCKPFPRGLQMPTTSTRSCSPSRDGPWGPCTSPRAPRASWRSRCCSSAGGVPGRPRRGGGWRSARAIADAAPGPRAPSPSAPGARSWPRSTASRRPARRPADRPRATARPGTGWCSRRAGDPAGPRWPATARSRAGSGGRGRAGGRRGGRRGTRSGCSSRATG